jgi:MFS family permease
VTPDDSRGRWVALVVCCSALFMTLLDVSVTNVALPSIARDTGAVRPSSSGSSRVTPSPSDWSPSWAASSATTTVAA